MLEASFQTSEANGDLQLFEQNEKTESKKNLYQQEEEASKILKGARATRKRSKEIYLIKFR